MNDDRLVKENYLIISDSDKNLLMMCVNTYIEKIEFILKNYRYYGISISDYVFSSFKEDLERLRNLQIKLFSIDIKE